MTKNIIIALSLLLYGCGIESTGFGSSSKFYDMCQNYDMMICGDDSSYVSMIGLDGIQKLEDMFLYKSDKEDDKWEPVRKYGFNYVGDCEDYAITAAEILFDDDSVIGISLIAGTAGGDGHAWLEITYKGGAVVIYDELYHGNDHVKYEEIVIK